ncbi:Uncharacterised protein [uncultured archaeon]|nr:Uncharacterised protein [uncultured archaeon]
MIKLKRGKKAVSPVVSTILLVMIVIILALIILLWSRGFVKEAYSKTIGGEEKPVEYYCSQLSLESFVNNDDSFGFKNQGTVPIYSFTLRLSTKGGDTNVEEYSPSNGGSVNPGGMITFEGKVHSDYKEVKVIPILLAKKKSGGNPEPVPCSSSNALII